MKEQKNRRFNRHSLRTKTILFFIAIGIWAWTFHTFIYIKSQQVEQSYTQLEKTHLKGQKATLKLQQHLQESMNLMAAFLQSGKVQYRQQWKQLWTESMPQELQVFKQSVLEASEGQSSLRTLKRHMVAYELFQQKQEELIAQIDQLKKQGLDEHLAKRSITSQRDAQLLYEQEPGLMASRMLIYQQLHGELIGEMNALHKENRRFNALLDQQLIENRLQFNEQIKTIRLALLIASIAGLALGFLLAFNLVKSLIMSTYHVKQAVKKLSMGDLPDKIPSTKNEMNYVIGELNLLVNNLREMKKFALNVGKGNFEAQIKVFNKEGELGNSLYTMKESLSKVAREDEQRNWVNEGFARFGELLRSEENITELCDQVISQLVAYLKANQGAIFLLNDQADEELMEMNACYAYSRKKYLNKQIRKGEGLIGQSWQEGDVLYLTDVPEEYINIRSGLGEASPRAVLIVPLKNNEQIVGVLEMATLSEFSDYQIEFISKLSETIAATISSTLNNERTVKLLEEAQEMTEAMQAQEEEMRQNMEELQAAQEEMLRAKQMTEKQEYNVKALINNTSDTIFSINTEYEITVVNDTLKNKYSKLGINLKTGTKLNELISDQQWQFWKARYDRALKGESFSEVEESSGTNGQRWVETFHNPIKDQEGNIIGVSVIARDITNLIKAQKDVVRKEATLNSLINNTSDTFFAINNKYEIIVINKSLKERFQNSGITLEEGMNVLEVLPEKDRDFWKERYDRVLSGENFVNDRERVVGNETLYIEEHYQPIMDAHGRIRGAAVVSKDITRWKIAKDEKLKREKEITKLRKALNMQEQEDTNLNSNSQGQN